MAAVTFGPRQNLLGYIGKYSDLARPFMDSDSAVISG